MGILPPQKTMPYQSAPRKTQLKITLRTALTGVLLACAFSVCAAEKTRPTDNT
jgi:hypothetical protein